MSLLANVYLFSLIGNAPSYSGPESCKPGGGFSRVGQPPFERLGCQCLQATFQALRLSFGASLQSLTRSYDVIKYQQGTP